MNEDCLLCGAPQPVAHVQVRSPRGPRGKQGIQIGRVCSKHTLREVINDRQERLDIEIVMHESYAENAGYPNLAAKLAKTMTPHTDTEA